MTGRQEVHLPSNRTFPLPKALNLTPREKQLLRDAPDSVLLSYNQPNPKKVGSKSFIRYENYKHCETLGQFRSENHSYDDLFHDIARGFARTTYEKPIRQETQSSFFNVAHLENLSSDTGMHRPIVDHYDSLSDLWKTVSDGQRIAQVITDLEAIAIDSVYNASSCTVENSPFDVNHQLHANAISSDDDLTASIANLCNMRENSGATLQGPTRCSRHEFIARVASLATDNYLKVENILRTAEQRPLVDETDTDADILRMIYASPTHGNVLHGDFANLAAAGAYTGSLKSALKEPDGAQWKTCAVEEWVRFYEYF